MRSFLVAVQFLTRIPVPVRDATAREIGRSALAFPLVGLLVGALSLGLYLGCWHIFPLPMARVVTLLAVVAVSGAFHLDGLADTVDGIYGGRTREDALRIMKDPHIGAMGVIAIVCALVGRVTASLVLPETAFRGALLCAPIAAHGAMVFAFAMPYAREQGLGRAFADHRSALDRVFAFLAGATAAFVFVRTAGLVSVAAAWLGAAVLLAFAWRSIRGVTGDVCGAAHEVAETVFFVALTAATAIPVGPQDRLWGWHL